MRALNSFLGVCSQSIYLIIMLFAKRLLRLLRHIIIVPFSPLKRNSFNWKHLHKARLKFYQIIWWIIVLITKILDLIGIWEFLDILFTLVKPNARKMTSIEILEAKKVFGESLPYNAIRIDERSVFAKIGAKSVGIPHLGLVTFRSVNFTRKINSTPGHPDMGWLIHELVHIAQMQALGAQYLLEALYAQHSSGYGYGGQKNLKSEKYLHAFNLEQQADIAKHYYQYVLYGKRESVIYNSYIDDICSGKF